METKTDIWMPLYIGDFLADTAHLDAERSGVYLHWLMHYWRKGPLPDDMQKLISIGKLRSPDALIIVHELLNDFFTQTADGNWHQKRADAEKASWNAKRLSMAEKAVKAAHARWRSKDATSIPQALPQKCSSSSPSPSNENTKTNTIPRSVPPDELAGTLPLVDGTSYEISKRQVAEWSQAFPAVDVTGELRKFKCWFDANPKKKKTRHGIARSIVSWLSRAQDRPTPVGEFNGNRAQQRTDNNIAAARRAAEAIAGGLASWTCGGAAS